MILHPYKVYYKDLLGWQDYLGLSNETKLGYFRFLNILTCGNPQMISIVMNVDLDEIYKMMVKYGFIPEPNDYSTDFDMPSQYYEAIKRRENKLLRDRQVDIDVVVSARKIVNRALLASMNNVRGAFDVAHDEVILSEVKLIDDAFYDFQYNAEVRRRLNDFITRRSLEIEKDIVLNRISDEEIDAIAKRREELAGMRNSKKAVDFSKKYCSIEDVIKKPAEKMTAGDVKRAVEGCPISPMHWSDVRDDLEYLRKIKIYFLHVPITRMNNKLFNTEYSNLCKQFRVSGAKTSPVSRCAKYQFENQAFDEWAAGLEESSLKDAGSTGVPLNENNSVDISLDGAISSGLVDEESVAKDAGSEEILLDKKEHDLLCRSVKEPLSYHLTIELESDNPASLYKMFAELLELFEDDARGRVSLNPFVTTIK